MIFLHLPQIYAQKNNYPIFSEFKTVFRLKIGWNFARFSSIFENVFPIEFFEKKYNGKDIFENRAKSSEISTDLQSENGFELRKYGRIIFLA